MAYHDYTPHAGVGGEENHHERFEALAREICRLQYHNPDKEMVVRSGSFQTSVGEMRAAPPTQRRWKAYERLAEGILQFQEQQNA
jgi:hypothetical protein